MKQRHRCHKTPTRKNIPKRTPPRKCDLSKKSIDTYMKELDEFDYGMGYLIKPNVIGPSTSNNDNSNSTNISVNHSSPKWEFDPSEKIYNKKNRRSISSQVDLGFDLRLTKPTISLVADLKLENDFVYDFNTRAKIREALEQERRELRHHVSKKNKRDKGLEVKQKDPPIVSNCWVDEASQITSNPKSDDARQPAVPFHLAHLYSQEINSLNYKPGEINFSTKKSVKCTSTSRNRKDEFSIHCERSSICPGVSAWKPQAGPCRKNMEMKKEDKKKESYHNHGLNSYGRQQDYLHKQHNHPSHKTKELVLDIDEFECRLRGI